MRPSNLTGHSFLPQLKTQQYNRLTRWQPGTALQRRVVNAPHHIVCWHYKPLLLWRNKTQLTGCCQSSTQPPNSNVLQFSNLVIYKTWRTSHIGGTVSTAARWAVRIHICWLFTHVHSCCLPFGSLLHCLAAWSQSATADDKQRHGRCSAQQALQWLPQLKWRQAARCWFSRAICLQQTHAATAMCLLQTSQPWAHCPQK